MLETIGVIGVSHKSAPLDVREQFSFSEDELPHFGKVLYDETNISHFVLLSTCNRMELYFTQSLYNTVDISEKVISAIKKYKGKEHSCSRFFYHHYGLDAVNHLFHVSSGTQSMVIGEDQIFGQLKDAYSRCTKLAFTDAVLMRLFQMAFTVGKEVRTHTDINVGHSSVSSMAVETCLSHFSDLSDKRILIVGAGETGALVLKNFEVRVIKNITLINRTLAKAQSLAKCYDVCVRSFETLSSEISQYDIIVVATSSQETLITPALLSTDRSGRHCNQLFVDLSVPRNVAQEIDQVQGCTVISVDDLKAYISKHTEKRNQSLEAASSIIDNHVQEFNDWMISRKLRPAIGTITRNLEAVHHTELENFKHIQSEELRTAVSEYTTHLTKRYSRLLVKNLKDLTNNGDSTISLEFIEDLFKLDQVNRKN